MSTPISSLPTTATATESAPFGWHFDDSYSRLPPTFYRRVTPAPLRDAFLFHANTDAAALLDLRPEDLATPEFFDFVSGQRIWPAMSPLAAVYAGHQFGVYVPQLGDGRAMLLGEIVNRKHERWDVQLKGAGLTPFSRMGDGRAVLRSTIREYLCSEAMHALGVPTTRALCIVGSREPVYRETKEFGAMLVRLAPSHVRFGSFEFFYYRRQPEQIKQLADYVISLHYPELRDAVQPYDAFFHEVINRTARLMAQWQAVGFAHGVMNTDNMSVLGLTLDYGPFGFLDEYNAGYICNHTDHTGRYAFGAQPQIGLWNLACLGQALSPILSQNALIDGLNGYQPVLAATYQELMHAKLGLTETRPDDFELVIDLLEAMQRNQVDYTRFFRALCHLRTDTDAPADALRDEFIAPQDCDAWVTRYRARLRDSAASSTENDDATRTAAMLRVNPKYILRNYLAQNAIVRAEAGDSSETARLLEILRRPFDEQPEHNAYAALPPAWSKHLEISCSS